jgi:hypothetical protein
VGTRALIVAKRPPDRFDVGACRRLVEGEAKRASVDTAEIHPLRDPAFRDLRRRLSGRDDDRVEEMRGGHAVAQPLETRLQDCGEPVHVSRDARESGRPVVHRVHRRHHCQQHLRRADVRRRLLAPDVLLARLQREAVRRSAVGVDGHADEAPRHRALEVVTRGKIARVRAAVPHRHAEALRRADDDIGAPFARRHDERERKEIGRGHHMAAAGVHGRREGAIVAHVAIRARILEQDREGSGFRRVRRGTGEDLDPERFSARAHDVLRLREDVVGHEEAVAFALAEAVAQRHCFGRGGRLVQHRRVGDRHSGQIADHRLVVDERFEPALRDLRLIRRVCRVPGGIFEHVAQDHARRVRAVIALADERFQHLVLRGDRLDPRQRLRLGHRGGKRERLLAPDRGGHDRVHQRGPRIESQGPEHRRLVFRRRADVPRDECGRVFHFRHHASPIVAS